MATTVKLSAAPQKKAPQKKVAQEATLEIFQTSSSVPGRLSLGILKLKGPMAGGAPGGAPPAKIKWKAASAAHPLLASIASEGIQVTELIRVVNPDSLFRALGGKKHEAASPPYAGTKGGYSFAKGDLDETALDGTAGMKAFAQIQSVEVEVAGKKERLAFLYPAGAQGDWLWGEINFRLSFTLRVPKVEGEGEDTWDGDGPEIKWPAHEFTRDASRSKSQLQTALKEEYGNPAKSPPLHARDWGSIVADDSPVGAAFAQACRDSATFVNGKLAADAGFSLTAAEVAVAMLSEGGIDVIQLGIQQNTAPENLSFDGYGNLGIDSFVTRWKNGEGHLRDYTPDALKARIENGTNLQTVTNEAGDTWQTFAALTLTEAVSAFAALWAWAKESFARDVMDAAVMGRWVTPVGLVPAHVQYFWTTIYFNTTSPRETLNHRGLGYHDLVWENEDDHARYQRYEKYNGNWRAATYRLFAATSGM